MNQFQALFEAQRALFATGVTRSYEWRIDQLDRMGRMVSENEDRLQEAIAQDFKTVPSEYVFETVAEVTGLSSRRASSRRGWSRSKRRSLSFCARPATRVSSTATRTGLRSSWGRSTGR